MNYNFPQNQTFAHDDIIYLNFPAVLPPVSSAVLTTLQGWTVHWMWPLATRTAQNSFIARFTIICSNNLSQTLCGSVEKKGRFVRENTGSGQTSGSVHIT